MKVLFVGDGRHDIGPNTGLPQPRQAGGVLMALCQKIAPEIADDSIALAWSDISRFNRAKKGLSHKLIAAKELAVRHGCLGTIAVADRDGPRGEDRIAALRAGKMQLAESKAGSYPIAVGIAVESIEAWTLGDPNAIATVLQVEVSRINDCYREVVVEEFSEHSGNLDRQPKKLLERVAALKHRLPDVGFRTEVAYQTNIGTLERNCPVGFAPFAAEVRREFASE